MHAAEKTFASGCADPYPSLPGSGAEDTAACNGLALMGTGKLFAWIWLAENDIMIYNTVF